jgi:hypothetical protein
MKLIKLTNKLWQQLEGICYSWSNAEVGLFGLRLPMAKGWPKLIIGKKYPVELYEQLALLRYERIKLDPVLSDPDYWETGSARYATAKQLSLLPQSSPLVASATRPYTIGTAAPPRPYIDPDPFMDDPLIKEALDLFKAAPVMDRSDRPKCTKCGEPVYATAGPHLELCEPCLWALQDSEQNLS